MFIDTFDSTFFHLYYYVFFDFDIFLPFQLFICCISDFSYLTPPFDLNELRRREDYGVAVINTKILFSLSEDCKQCIPILERLVRVNRE